MTQNKAILSHLKSGKPLTALGALSLYGCFRLASRIGELKQQGHNIKSRKIETEKGTWISQYFI